MSQIVCSGASLMCSFGTAPSNLVATNAPMTLVDGKPAATVADAAPMTNIMPFGMCTTRSNPQVAAATAAALGVLTPQPCVPATASWIPSQMTVLAGGKPCVTQDAKCMCMYGGNISVANPGQMIVSN